MQPLPQLTIIISNLTGGDAVVLFNLITVTGVARQRCCTGTAVSGTGGTVPTFGTTASDCKSADVASNGNSRPVPQTKNAARSPALSP
jgi:hypothetical protein